MHIGTVWRHVTVPAAIATLRRKASPRRQRREAAQPSSSSSCFSDATKLTSLSSVLAELPRTITSDESSWTPAKLHAAFLRHLPAELSTSEVALLPTTKKTEEEDKLQKEKASNARPNQEEGLGGNAKKKKKCKKRKLPGVVPNHPSGLASSQIDQPVDPAPIPTSDVSITNRLPGGSEKKLEEGVLGWVTAPAAFTSEVLAVTRAFHDELRSNATVGAIASFPSLLQRWYLTLRERQGQFLKMQQWHPAQAAELSAGIVGRLGFAGDSTAAGQPRRLHAALHFHQDLQQHAVLSRGSSEGHVVRLTHLTTPAEASKFTPKLYQLLQKQHPAQSAGNPTKVSTAVFLHFILYREGVNFPTAVSQLRRAPWDRFITAASFVSSTFGSASPTGGIFVHPASARLLFPGEFVLKHTQPRQITPNWTAFCEFAESALTSLLQTNLQASPVVIQVLGWGLHPLDPSLGSFGSPAEEQRLAVSPCTESDQGSMSAWLSELQTLLLPRMEHDNNNNNNHPQMLSQQDAAVDVSLLLRGVQPGTIAARHLLQRVRLAATRVPNFFAPGRFAPRGCPASVLDAAAAFYAGDPATALLLGLILSHWASASGLGLSPPISPSSAPVRAGASLFNSSSPVLASKWGQEILAALHSSERRTGRWRELFHELLPPLLAQHWVLRAPEDWVWNVELSAQLRRVRRDGVWDLEPEGLGARASATAVNPNPHPTRTNPVSTSTTNATINSNSYNYNNYYVHPGVVGAGGEGMRWNQASIEKALRARLGLSNPASLQALSRGSHPYRALHQRPCWFQAGGAPEVGGRLWARAFAEPADGNVLRLATDLQLAGDGFKNKHTKKRNPESKSGKQKVWQGYFDKPFCRITDRLPPGLLAASAAAENATKAVPSSRCLVLQFRLPATAWLGSFLREFVTLEVGPSSDFVRAPLEEAYYHNNNNNNFKNEFVSAARQDEAKSSSFSSASSVKTNLDHANVEKAAVTVKDKKTLDWVDGNILALQHP